MKRKDYALLAKFVKKLKGYISGTQTTANPFGIPIRELVFDNLVLALKKDNSNFNVAQFTKDCGL